MTRFRVFHHLQKAHSALFRAADNRGRQELDLSTSQMAVLIILLNDGALPSTALAARLSMANSGITGLVDRLSTRGLVSRKPATTDGRSILVHLTETGEALAMRARQDTGHYNETLLAPFSDEECEVIRRFLTHLEDNADAIIAGGPASHG